MTGAAVEVVLYHLDDDPASVTAAYHEASRRMAGTPGLLGNQLLVAVGDPRSFVVVSRWADWAAFTAWEGGAGHQDQTAPLRPFRDTTRERPFEIYRELARYGTARATAPASGG
ncbi:antibiotic biosynthesis monooxygenase family protein [Streptomyces albipurpureus]|uniref:Antibiotic biosynthesis monooxygenase n=1 Tax=Streptomyces albipurpureus TaxID=2897419 RepID=A0ABT0UFR5_9ACTN|nr:antibiotic biosynthesis monooxygenase family protein [Streptomyces sp. CWNU-1]MCM2387243.1 antibiotic biosynthesis monooxygenase [Streptomyces sp. CWNU-1]